jgi:hypothetical protein
MRHSIAAFLALTACVCCGGGPAEPSGSGQPGPPALPASATFSRSPIDVSAISTITPIGNLNPPDHTLPTNHAYFFHPSQANAEVRALSAGTIRNLTRGSGGADDQLNIAVSTHLQYYLGHVLLDAAIVQNQQVAAGQRLGVTTSAAGAMDLGVINDTITLFFVRPDRYIPGTLHADSPLKYFDEPLRSELYAKVTSAEKDGRINFDQTGRLAGNWFLPDLAASVTENFGNGSKHLAFVRDVNNPDLVRISIGGSVGPSGAYYVQRGAADPADVSPDTGRIGYTLLVNPAATIGAGTLIVEMIAADRIRVQAFPSGTPITSGFTDAALTYVR